MAAPALSQDELAAFVRDGAVTVDTGVSAAQIAAASAAMFAAAPQMGRTLRSGRTKFRRGPTV
jgi:hypothetical protein